MKHGVLLVIVGSSDARVECVLADVRSRSFRFRGDFRVPALVDPTLPSPPSAFVPCEVRGRDGFRVWIETDVASLEGARRFLVFASQVVSEAALAEPH